MNLYLVRHAHAGDRERWDGHDEQRPLSAKGRDQASALTAALAGAPITRVLSSPALRCQQTVHGVARQHGLDVEVVPKLAEDAPLPGARALIDRLARANGDVVACGHGDLIPALVQQLRREGVHVEGSGCAKGSIWRLVASNGRYERAEYHKHPDDLMRRTG